LHPYRNDDLVGEVELRLHLAARRLVDEEGLLLSEAAVLVRRHGNDWQVLRKQARLRQPQIKARRPT